MQRLHIDGRRSRFRLRPEHPGSPLQELSLPGRDLVGMNVKLLRQLSQRLLAPYGSQGHLRFESRRVVPAGSSAHRLSCSAAILAAVRQRLHLSNLFKNPEPALYWLVKSDGHITYDIVLCGSHPSNSSRLSTPTELSPLLPK